MKNLSLHAPLIVSARTLRRGGVSYVLSVCTYVAFGCLASSMSASAQTATASKPVPLPRAAHQGPNVLFIAVDDLRPLLGCYGTPIIKTPNIDGLARRGLRFTRAYCQSAICGPSRASVLTGLRPDSTGIHDLGSTVRQKLPNIITLPQLFRQTGYETVSIGKVYHQFNDDDALGWSKPASWPTGKWTGRGYLSNGPQDSTGRGPPWENIDVDGLDYQDGQIATEAIQELRRLKTQNARFFLAVGFKKPHLPFSAPKRFWDLYNPVALPAAPRKSWPEGMPPIAGWNWGELRDYAGMPREGPVEGDVARTLVHGYYACVSYVDAQVGRVLDELDRQGLRRNTLVILWGDNGWKLGDYGAWCKATNFELDARIPLIIATPDGVSAGKSSSALDELVDLYPTLAQLCKLGVPAHCEGTSFMPVLHEPDCGWKPAAFTQFPREPKIMGYSMRLEGLRYTEWIDRKTKRVVERELYDHSNSEVATVNLVHDPHYAARIPELSATLAAGFGWRRWQNTKR